MKMLFVLEHYYPYLGGAEKLFRQVAEGLVAAGHEVEVVTTHFRPDLPQLETLGGVRIHRIKCYNRFLFTIFSLPAIWRAAKAADLIHTTTYNAALPAWLIGRLRGKRVLITFHEYWGQLWFRLPYLSWWGRRAFYLYEQFILRLPFHRYIAVSKATQQSLEGGGIASEKITQIYNGLDYQRITKHHCPVSRRGDAFRLVYYGRLGVSKGLNLLLPAFGRFASAYNEAELHLVIPTYPQGLYQAVLKQVNALNLGDRLQLHHELSDNALFNLVQAASAVVIPSYSEGFCFVAAEAVAFGRPIVSSGQTALQETVTGKYVEMEAMQEEALLQALERAYQGDWDERPLRYFYLSESIKAYLDLLQTVLAGKA